MKSERTTTTIIKNFKNIQIDILTKNSKYSMYLLMRIYTKVSSPAHHNIFQYNVVVYELTHTEVGNDLHTK